MMIPVLALLGFCEIPKDRSAASKWIKRNSVRLVRDTTDRREPELVTLSDLPALVRLAYAAREAERAGLAPGVHDEAADEALALTPATMRA